MIDMRFVIKEDEKEVEPQKETFYSGTTLENLRTCLIEGSDGKLYFDKSKEPRHRKPEAIFCVDDFDHATWYALDRAKYTKGTPILLEGKLGSEDVMFHMLLRGKPFPVENVWLNTKECPDYFKGANKVENAQEYFEPRNPLDLV